MTIKHSTAAIIAVSVFAAILFTVTTIHSYSDISTLADGRTYKSSYGKNNIQSSIEISAARLMEWKVPEDWKQELEELAVKVNNASETQNKTLKTIVEGTKMTREELGQHGWSLLHMIAATFPENAD
jgi:hypothetical protein